MNFKPLFIIPTDAHNYKIIGMLKTIKIPTIAPTCPFLYRVPHACTTGWYAAITLTTSLTTSTLES